MDYVLSHMTFASRCISAHHLDSQTCADLHSQARRVVIDCLFIFCSDASSQFMAMLGHASSIPPNLGGPQRMTSPSFNLTISQSDGSPTHSDQSNIIPQELLHKELSEFPGNAISASDAEEVKCGVDDMTEQMQGSQSDSCLTLSHVPHHTGFDSAHMHPDKLWAVNYVEMESSSNEDTYPSSFKIWPHDPCNPQSLISSQSAHEIRSCDQMQSNYEITPDGENFGASESGTFKTNALSSQRKSVMKYRDHCMTSGSISESDAGYTSSAPTFKLTHCTYVSPLHESPFTEADSDSKSEDILVSDI